MKYLRTKGFTLVETLVAILILSIAIAAAMTAVQVGLQSSYFARDQIVAFYLGEEAIENVRNIRDQNWNSNQPDWLNGMDICMGTGVTCKIDASKAVATLETCSGTTCRLSFNKDTQLYSHETVGGNIVASKFTRTIHIDQVTDDNILVTVVVSWNSGTFTNRSLTFKEELYNWNGN